MSLQNKPLQTFIYFVPSGCKRKYNPCTELTIIDEFINLGYRILPIYNFYLLRTLLIILQKQKIDGIIVNSLKTLWSNRLILRFNSTIPIYWWYFDNAFSKVKITKKTANIN